MNVEDVVLTVHDPPAVRLAGEGMNPVIVRRVPVAVEPLLLQVGDGDRAFWGEVVPLRGYLTEGFWKVQVRVLL